MKEMHYAGFCRRALLGLAFCAGMTGVFFSYIPPEFIRGFLLVFCSAAILATTLWALWQRQLLSDFSNDICETVDALMEGREPEHLFHQNITDRMKKHPSQKYRRNFYNTTTK